MAAYSCNMCLQCFDAVGWVAGTAPASKKLEWWGAGMDICLEQGADLHMFQLMPLPLTVSCFSWIQIGLTFLVQAHTGSPGKRAVKWVRVCVYSCNIPQQTELMYNDSMMSHYEVMCRKNLHDVSSSNWNNTSYNLRSDVLQKNIMSPFWYIGNAVDFCSDLNATFCNMLCAVEPYWVQWACYWSKRLKYLNINKYLTLQKSNYNTRGVINSQLIITAEHKGQCHIHFDVSGIHI